MMMNPEAVAAGVAVGIAAEQANKFIEYVRGEESLDAPTVHGLLTQQRDFLRLIAQALNEQLTPNLNHTTLLQPYPLEFRIPPYDRKHLSLFLPSGVGGSVGAYTPVTTTAKLYIEIPGAGTHIKSINPGWNQLDLPPGTLLATGDGLNYTVILSYRDDALGVQL